jgi:hypothetical protein
VLKAIHPTVVASRADTSTLDSVQLHPPDLLHIAIHSRDGGPAINPEGGCDRSAEQVLAARNQVVSAIFVAEQASYPAIGHGSMVHPTRDEFGTAGREPYEPHVAEAGFHGRHGPATSINAGP